MTIQEELVSAVGDGRGTIAADRLCEACVALFAVDAAAISLVFDGASTGTLGVSSDRARAYDELQFTVGEGPCLETVATRGPVFVVDLADLNETRWPAYATAMLAHHVRGVFAVPVVVAGECLGALDLFCDQPGMLASAVVTGALVAAELAQVPVLDLLGTDLRSAISDPDSDAWTELSAITRSEVSQATGMLVAQLDVDPAHALLRLRAHAYSVGQSASQVARDILERRLRLDAD